MRYTRITLLCVVLCYATSSYAAPFLYVANRGDDTVSVIDTETNTVIATVSVGRSPDVIEAHPFGVFVYVYNGGSGTISVIDTSINEVVATVSRLMESELQGDQSGIFDLAIHPAGTSLYTGGVTISIIDPVAHAFVEEIDVRGNPFFFVEVHPAGTVLYAADNVSQEVLVIDTATNSVIERVNVDTFVWGMVIHPEGRFLYVGSLTESTVSVIDTATNTVVATVFVGPDENGIVIEDIQVHPEGTFVYVSDIQLDGSISVIDTASNTVVGRIPTQSSHLALHPAGTLLYATAERENFIAVIDTATNTVIDSIVVGNDPEAIAIAQPVSRRISGCIDLGGVSLVQQKVTLKQADEVKQKTSTDAKGCYAFESIASGKTFKVIIKGPAVP